MMPMALWGYAIQARLNSMFDSGKLAQRGGTSYHGGKSKTFKMNQRKELKLSQRRRQRRLDHKGRG
jgi:hypothetical protein